MSLDGGGLFLDSAPAFERAILAHERFGEAIPTDVLEIQAEHGAFVVCCPWTGVALTSPMARAVGLTEEALAAMLEKKFPLGVKHAGEWDDIVRRLAKACNNDAYDGPSLNTGSTELAVGGSAIACFSSAQTAFAKKQFPRSEEELERQIRRSRYNQGLPEDVLSAKVADARAVYKELNLHRHPPPQAPWFGILARLHIEPPADVDIQLHSTVVNEILLKKSIIHPAIDARRWADRLGRWDPQDVYEAIPALADLRGNLAATGAPVELEFLGPAGRTVIAGRRDWWRIDLNSERRASS